MKEFEKYDSSFAVLFLCRRKENIADLVTKMVPEIEVEEEDMGRQEVVAVVMKVTAVVVEEGTMVMTTDTDLCCSYMSVNFVVGHVVIVKFTGIYHCGFMCTMVAKYQQRQRVELVVT